MASNQTHRAITPTCTSANTQFTTTARSKETQMMLASTPFQPVDTLIAHQSTQRTTKTLRTDHRHDDEEQRDTRDSHTRVNPRHRVILWSRCWSKCALGQWW